MIILFTLHAKNVAIDLTSAVRFSASVPVQRLKLARPFMTFVFGLDHESFFLNEKINPDTLLIKYFLVLSVGNT